MFSICVKCLPVETDILYLPLNYEQKFIFQASLTPEQIAKLTVIRQSCAKESGVSAQHIDDIMSGKFADDAKLKSFMTCAAKKIGFVNAAGELQHDVLKAKSAASLGDQALADKLDAECAIKKATVEDTVFDAVKCYYEKTGKPVLVG